MSEMISPTALKKHDTLADYINLETNATSYWSNFPKFIASTGLLKTSDGKVVHPEDIDYASLFTNDYLPCARGKNRFKYYK